MKLLKAEKDNLLRQKKEAQKTYHYYRDYQKELNTVCSNVDMILREKHKFLLTILTAEKPPGILRREESQGAIGKVYPSHFSTFGMIASKLLSFSLIIRYISSHFFSLLPYP